MAKTDRLHSVLCAALVVACVLLTRPILAMGVNDDWSYAWTARAFATTGHLAYNGWVGAIVGVQAIWTGFPIRAFGFSFTLVRLSNLPFAAGCAVLLYRLGRSAGLTPPFALFGTAAVTLSPMFIPLSASYMTDVPGLFFWLATLYGGLLALRAESAARACGWLAATAVLGVAGGTVRQTVWLVPVTVLPAVAWLRRKERATVAVAAALWCASGVAMALCLRWFLAQPHTGISGVYEPMKPLELLNGMTEAFFELAVGCLMFLLPVLAIHLAGWRLRLRAEYRQLLAGLLVTGILMGVLFWWFEDDLLLGNIVTEVGMLGQGLDLLGDRPEVLGAPVRVLLGLAILVSAAFTFAALRRRRTAQPEEDTAGLIRFAILAVPPCLLYTLVILYRAAVWNIYDRYLIVLLPVLTIPLLWRRQQADPKPLPWFGWAMIGAFAMYGVAITHDYFAGGRAKLQAAAALTAAGIPRTQITAGLEYDAWTELETSGLIRQRSKAEMAYPEGLPQFWFWKDTPSIGPQYFVTYSPLQELRDAHFAPVRYSTWLPPFHRQLYTQVK